MLPAALACRMQPARHALMSEWEAGAATSGRNASEREEARWVGLLGADREPMGWRRLRISCISLLWRDMRRAELQWEVPMAL